MGLGELLDSADEYIKENQGFVFGSYGVVATALLDTIVIASNPEYLHGEVLPMAEFMYNNLGLAGLFVYKSMITTAIITIAKKDKRLNWGLYAVTAAWGTIALVSYLNAQAGLP